MKDADRMLFHAAPAGGGYLVLTKAHLNSKPFMKLLGEVYPNTKIIQQRTLPVRGGNYTRKSK